MLLQARLLFCCCTPLTDSSAHVISKTKTASQFVCLQSALRILPPVLMESVLAPFQTMAIAKQIQARLFLIVFTLAIQRHLYFLSKIACVNDLVLLADCEIMTSTCTPSTDGVCTAQGSVEDQNACTVDSSKSLCLTIALQCLTVLSSPARGPNTFVLPADCKVTNSSCLSSKCSSPKAIGDADTCKQASGKFLCPYIAHL